MGICLSTFTTIQYNFWQSDSIKRVFVYLLLLNTVEPLDSALASKFEHFFFFFFNYTHQPQDLRKLYSNLQTRVGW